MGKDKEIEIEILEDGTARVVTGDLSGPLHLQADQLLAAFAKALGGKVKTEKLAKAHVHRHGGQTHEH